MAAKSIISIEVRDSELKALEDRVKRLQENLSKPFVMGGGRGSTGGGVTGGAGGNAVEFHKSIAASMNQQSHVLQSIVNNMRHFNHESREAAIHWKSIAGSAGALAGGGRGGGVAGGGGAAGGGGGAPSFLTMAGMAGGGLGGLRLAGVGRLALTPGLAGLAVAGGVIGGAAIVSGIMAVVEGVKTAVGFGFGLAGLGGNMLGLDRLALTGASGRRNTLGLGIDYGSMKAAQNVFGTTFDPNKVMQGIATAKADFTSDAALALITTGARNQGDTGEVMLRLREQARQFALRTPEDQLGPLSEVYGYNQFFSTQDLRRLKRQSSEEFEKDTATERRRAEQFALSDSNLRKWKDFSVTLDAAGTKIETSFLKNLDKVVPQLEQMSEGLSNAIAAMLQGPGFANLVTAVSSGLERFGAYVGRGDFQKDLESLAGAAATVANALLGIARFVGSPVGTTVGAIAGSNAGNAASAVGSAIWRNSLPGLAGQALGKAMDWMFPPANAAQAGGGGGGSAGFSDPKWSKYIKAMMGMGWSYEQATGIVSNLKEESGGNPYAVGDQGKAFGLAQWHPDRQAQFKGLFGKDIRQSSEIEQLRFIDWELRNTEARAGAMLSGAKSVEEAHRAFLRYYERPSAENVAARSGAESATRMSQANPYHVVVNNRVVVENTTGANIEVNASKTASAQ